MSAPDTQKSSNSLSIYEHNPALETLPQIKARDAKDYPEHYTNPWAKCAMEDRHWLLGEVERLQVQVQDADTMRKAALALVEKEQQARATAEPQPAASKEKTYLEVFKRDDAEKPWGLRVADERGPVIELLYSAAPIEVRQYGDAHEPRTVHDIGDDERPPAWMHWDGRVISHEQKKRNPSKYAAYALALWAARTSQPQGVRRRPTLEQSNSFTVEQERDWWRDYALAVEGSSQPPAVAPTFDEWQRKHGPSGGAYDIEMQRAGWDGATATMLAEVNRLRGALKQVGDDYPGSSCQRWCYEQAGLSLTKAPE